jgi:hypothetical protein
VSKCDTDRSDIRFMKGNEAPSGSIEHAPGSRSGETEPLRYSESRTIWLCPSPVCLTATEIAAALYAFSDLISEAPEPATAAVREELSFVVARYGTALIEHVADWLTAESDARLPELLTDIGVGLDTARSVERMTWCLKQAELALGSQAA